MNLTQEQRLDICKFLAEKLGKKGFEVVDLKYGAGTKVLCPDERGGHFFDPFANRAQWAEVLDAAWMAGYRPAASSMGEAFCGNFDGRMFWVKHDNTPESRAAAVLVAISRAWGWTKDQPS